MPNLNGLWLSPFLAEMQANSDTMAKPIEVPTTELKSTLQSNFMIGEGIKQQ